jgi:hypothetical protein
MAKTVSMICLIILGRGFGSHGRAEHFPGLREACEGGRGRVDRAAGQVGRLQPSCRQAEHRHRGKELMTSKLYKPLRFI